VNVRPVRPEDREEWLRRRTALWPHCARETHLADMAESLGDASRWAVFVAEKDAGGLAGFVEISLQEHAAGCDTSPVGYVEGWYVDADQRRAGVGSQLLAAAERWAVAHGCREMASDCDVSNGVSLAAHLALGYEEVQRVVQLRKWVG